MERQLLVVCLIFLFFFRRVFVRTLAHRHGRQWLFSWPAFSPLFSSYVRCEQFVKSKHLKKGRNYEKKEMWIRTKPWKRKGRRCGRMQPVFGPEEPLSGSACLSVSRIGIWMEHASVVTRDPSATEEVSSARLHAQSKRMEDLSDLKRESILSNLFFT